MKRFLSFLMCAALTLPVLVQCSQYDDTWIKDKFGEIDSRIARLEQSINDLNAYKSIVDNLRQGKLISSVRDNGDGTFTLTFNDETTATITTLKGEKGDPGDPGKPGADGTNGTNGTNGTDGTNGIDGITPDFKIQDGDWYVSYDKGATWTKLGSASSNDSFFFKDVRLDGDSLVLVLIDGTEIRLDLTGGQGGGEDPVSVPTLDDWVGKWVSNDSFEVSITKYSDALCYLQWLDDTYNAYVQIPLDFDAATGKMSISMPENRSIGGNYNNGAGVSYYLNLYTDANKRLSPDPAAGTLLATLSLNETGDAVTFSSANASDYYYFYARPYVWDTGSWGSSVFYLYLTEDQKLVAKEEGGEPEVKVPTVEDWLGSWSNRKNTTGTLTFYESNGKFYCYSPTSNLNAVPIQFHFNEEDGTIDFTSTRTDGYCGSFKGDDGQSHYVYYYAQDANKTYLSIEVGSVILKGTLSEDKTSITFDSGIGNCTRVLWYDNTASTWGSAPQNWIDTFYKAE